MTSLKVVDLHCDLLTYLAASSLRSPADVKARCSLPHLQAGGVEVQVLAIWAVTENGSSQVGNKQFQIFKNLSHQNKSPITFLWSIENASAFSEEDENLQTVLERLHSWMLHTPPLYISLTWNGENRFGGGASTKIGLKEDGKALLRFLSNKKVAVDLSHASDALALDIFNYIESQSLKIPVMASHSNFRSVTSVARNLPDEFALEITRRGGLIGLNFITQFVGKERDPFLTEHVNHALKLGIEKSMCFGADFFCDDDLPQSLRTFSGPSFFEEAPDARVYPRVLEFWKTKMLLNEEIVRGIASENFERFCESLECNGLRFFYTENTEICTEITEKLFRT